VIDVVVPGGTARRRAQPDHHQPRGTGPRLIRKESHMANNAITLKVPLEVSTGHGPNWDAAAH